MKAHFKKIKSVRKIKNEVYNTENLQLAVDFIRSKYPDYTKGKKVNIKLSGINTRPMFYHPSKENPGGLVRIGATSVIYLYKRKSVGLTTPEHGIHSGYLIATQCALVHELTHWVQSLRGSRYGEVETTRNEIEFLQTYYPEVYDKLIEC